jgi:hypothetical protein
MKKNSYNYILIISIIILITITIFFIAHYNVKLESLDITKNIDTNDEAMAEYNKDSNGLINDVSCFIECNQQTNPNKCNYALFSGDLDGTYNPTSCKLYNTINNSMYSSSKNLVYMPTEPYDYKLTNEYKTQNNKEYTTANEQNIITKIKNVHKLTCDYECFFNPLCTSYTTTSSSSNSTDSGTCTFYKGTNRNIIDSPNLNMHTKLNNNYFR